jgi:hypothetical protein
MVDIGEGPMQVEFQASMRIFGTGLDFDMISHTLGFQPSEIHRHGDLGILKPYSEDMWRVDSPLPRTDSLDAHLAWLRQVLSPHYDFLRTLARRFTLSSYCGVGVDDNHCTFQISAEALKIFLEMGTPLNLSIVMTGVPEPTTNALPESTSQQPEVGFDGCRQESSASLQIIGSGLDISHISATLTLTPSETHRPSHFHREAGEGKAPSWSFWSGMPRSKELDAHLKRLEAVLLPHIDFLRSLPTNAKLLFSCDIATENDHGGVEISPEALRIPVQLDVPMEFNVCLI